MESVETLACAEKNNIAAISNHQVLIVFFQQL
jgi:hypothetical protein